MPVPGGEITSTDLWTAPAVEETVEEVVEVSTIDVDTFASTDIELPAGLDTNDLPELS